jgi:heme exporter protein CcmD
MSGDYAFYVWTAYGFSGLGLAAAIALTVYGWLHARAAVAALEKSR